MPTTSAFFKSCKTSTHYKKYRINLQCLQHAHIHIFIGKTNFISKKKPKDEVVVYLFVALALSEYQRGANDGAFSDGPN